MQQVVNQIHWAPTFDSGFMMGAKIKVQSNGSVIYKNPLMTSGVAICTWQGSMNYQAAKTVPQLPHLKIGHQYRLVFHGYQRPSNTIIIRLVFFNVQGQEIKRFDFYNFNNYFTVPAETIRYNLQIINGGNRELGFKRIDLCETNVSLEANSDLWFQSPINIQSREPLRILMVKAGKRAKKTYPVIRRHIKHYPYQVMVVDSQFDGDLSSELLNWLNKKRQYHATLISCDPELDNVALKIQAQLHSIKTLITNESLISPNNIDECYAYQQKRIGSWVNRNLSDPNWDQIFRGIQEQLGGR